MFPNSVGNFWQYQYDLPDSGTADYKTVVGTTTINNKEYFILETTIHTNVSQRFLRKDSTGKIWRYNEKENKEYLWFDFSLPDSSIYYFAPNEKADSFVVHIYHNIQIETPAGTFQNCYKFFFDIPQSNDDEQWFVFAPGVGLVKEQYASVKQLLSSAQINGRLITKVIRNQSAEFDFKLEQNFPNPFNPSTQITFTIRDEGNIKITVFNLLGNEIEILLSDYLTRGSHVVSWEPVGLPNGVYFYTIESERFTQTKKMLFLK